MITINSLITGFGSYTPEFKLTNSMLESMIETNDEWIVKRTGIKSRNIAKGETTCSVASKAAQDALNDWGGDISEIELIIACTVTPDNFTPSLACMVQAEIGADNAAAFDLNAACSGFVYGVDVADSFIKAGKYKKILVVCAEVLSKLVDYKDRSTCILFGDGAGAVVVEATDTQRGILATYMAADGKSGSVLTAKALATEETPFEERHNMDISERGLRMGGAEVMKFAVTAVPKAIDKVLEKSEVDISDVDWVVPHQANTRIIDNVIKRYGLDEEKVYVNLPFNGNTSSASIPLCLAEMKRNGSLKEGQLAIFVGFGGGLTYGSVLVRF